MLEIGSTAPPLRGPAWRGDQQVEFDLDALRGQPAIVYFYPKDSTTACTVEARDFRDAVPRFQAAGVAVIGVSRDSLRSHARFADKEQLPFALVSDTDGAITEAWGVWRDKTLYGRTSPGIVRSTFLVDADGRIAAMWDKVRVAGHVGAVEAAVAGLRRPQI